ncbi:MAG: hypothetical protein AAGJ52_07720 [Pseudomonadota bacterium]
MRSLLVLCLISITSLGMLIPDQARANPADFRVNVAGSTISFALANPRLPHTGAELIVTGPQGFNKVKRFNAGQYIFFDVFRDGAARSGQFNYELRLMSVEEPRAGMGMPQAEVIALPRLNGAFTVASSQIVSEDLDEQGTQAVVIADDQVVQGSICAGLDCNNNESFGFTTLLLKENNLRIRFNDTSNSASFPSTDWELRANDTTNGGANQFSIVDFSADREVLVVQAGAPENSLLIDDQGQVGFGTATPLLNLHVTDSNTPAMRLDQDGTGGFAAQAWDVGSNELEFFVRNATSLTIPFSIDVNAPNDALVVDAGGNIGMGVLAPESNLHINGAGESARMTLESAAGVWDATVSTEGFTIDDASTGNTELQLSAQGDLSVAGSLRTSSTVELPSVSPDQTADPLAEVEAHLQRYGQLPGIGERAGQGHDVIEFQMQLLEAIQQLTLQNIEQQKEIEALRGQIARMRR